MSAGLTLDVENVAAIVEVIYDDVFDLFLQKQKSAQSYIPQGYLPPYESVQRA
jgi:hypothetical protein